MKRILTSLVLLFMVSVSNADEIVDEASMAMTCVQVTIVAGMRAQDENAAVVHTDLWKHLQGHADWWFEYLTGLMSEWATREELQEALLSENSGIFDIAAATDEEVLAGLNTCIKRRRELLSLGT